MTRENKTGIILISFLLVSILIKYCPPLNVPATRSTETISVIDSSRFADVAQIKKRGKLIAITDNSSTSYFVYKGEPMGYEYELLSLFAKHLGVELEIRIAKNMDLIIEQLNEGEADIIAANLTVTKERALAANFTYSLLQTRQVLVQRLPEDHLRLSQKKLWAKMVRSPSELIGKEIHVRKNSSFYQRLVNLSDETGGGFLIVEAPGNYETEELIGLVSKGVIDYTVADENVALVNKGYYNNIDVSTAISLPQQIAWAVRKSSPELLCELNEWIDGKDKAPLFAGLYTKYFVNRKAAEFRNESPYFSKTGGNISVYDHAIKTYCKNIGWDWRLLASLIYQESRFDPEAHSWAGAHGLMQLMPATATRYGVDSLSATPIQSISAGTRYLHSLDKYWKKHINDSNERIKFVLASYNVGLGHVIDARQLAIKYGYEPGKWTGNVEWCLLQKSKPQYYNDPVVKHGYCRGREPSLYVKQILTRYSHYMNVIDQTPNTNDIARAE